VPLGSPSVSRIFTPTVGNAGNPNRVPTSSKPARQSTLHLKRALFARLASSIEAGGVVRAADVIVNLVEVKKENWSFGNGSHNTPLRSAF
jgi:hypothetical protein